MKYVVSFKYRKLAGDLANPKRLDKFLHLFKKEFETEQKARTLWKKVRIFRVMWNQFADGYIRPSPFVHDSYFNLWMKELEIGNMGLVVGEVNITETKIGELNEKGSDHIGR